MKLDDLKKGMFVVYSNGMFEKRCIVYSVDDKYVHINNNEDCFSVDYIDWEKTAELNGFNANNVELNGLKAKEVFVDESDHIALIENRGGGCQYEEVMTCHAQIMKSFKDKPISDVRLATMSMIAHKMARLVCGYGDDDDNLKDIAGYAELERMTLKGD